jgi:hypothetical protein
MRYAAAGSRWRSPLVISAQASRPILLASAIAATRGWRRQQLLQHRPAGAVPLGIANDRHGADEQHPPQITVACLGDAAKLLLAACE